MSAAQQRNWFLAATLAATAVLAILSSSVTASASKRSLAKEPAVVKKIKAKGDASPQPLLLAGSIAPAVTAAIPVPAERIQLVAKLNEPVAAGAIIGTTPTDPGAITSQAVRAPARGILVETQPGRLGIAPDPAVLAAHATITAGELTQVREGQKAEVRVDGQAGPPLRGSVKHVGEVDGNTGSFPVEIAIQSNNRERLFSPMPASIRLLPQQ